MATSACKSSSRNPNTSPTTKPSTVQPRKQRNPTQKVGSRRSRSVSAFSRTEFDITSDFNNTRENPLFWADGSDSSEQFEGDFSNLKGNVINGKSRRGRSISRNSVGGDTKVFGGGGRRRSLSRGPRFGNYEDVREQECNLPSSTRSSNRICLNRNHGLLDEKNKLARSACDVSEIFRGFNTWSSQHPAFETSDGSAASLYGFQTPHCNDGMSKRAISEVAERIIRPVSEEMKVIHWEDQNIAGGILETVRTEVRRAISDMHKDLQDVMLKSNSVVITSSMFSDVAPELPNPNAVELVRDFREEFLRELEEYEERTIKLRDELAVEECCELELNQILSDMIPGPETPQVEKARSVKKASTERKKMSKRLEEEAMVYFDECISISTYNDSDFSSFEDPSSHTTNVGETTGVPAIPNKDSVACSLASQDLRRQSSPIYCDAASIFSTSGISRSNTNVTTKLSDSTSHEQGIINYVKKFSKDKYQESSKSNVVISVPRKSESYDSNIPLEKLLLDRMNFRSRIASGGMLLCSAGFDFPCAPFCASLW